MGAHPFASIELWEFPLGEALVLARPDIQGLFILNSTSRLIWSGYRAGNSIEALASQFSIDFGIPANQAALDIRATLESWSQELLAAPRPMSTSSDGWKSVPLGSFFRPCFVGNYLLGERQFRIEVSSQEFADEIAPRLAHLRSDTQCPSVTFQVARVDSQFRLYTDGVFFAEEPDIYAARVVFLQELARVAQYNIEWLAILHAGACGTATECVVLAANTNVGKTTLTAALMHSGMQFFSDDSVAIDRTLRVSAMPFALMLREGSWPVLASRFPELASVPILERNGCNVRFLPPPSHHQLAGAAPKCLLFIEFRSGAPTTLDPLTPFESLLRLEKTGVWVAQDRNSIGQFLAWIGSIPSYQAIYSDLDEATVLIHGLLAAVPVA